MVQITGNDHSTEDNRGDIHEPDVAVTFARSNGDNVSESAVDATMLQMTANDHSTEDNRGDIDEPNVVNKTTKRDAAKAAKKAAEAARKISRKKEAALLT
jgi:hypothetical protein